jgi:hypothetical protein
MFSEGTLIRFWSNLQQHTGNDFLKNPVVFSQETHDMHPHKFWNIHIVPGNVAGSWRPISTFRHVDLLSQEFETRMGNVSKSHLGRWLGSPVFFFFFFLWYWGLNSEPTPWATPPALSCVRYFWDRVLQNYLPGASFKLWSPWSLPPE